MKISRIVADPVAVSCAAYTEHVNAYTAAHATKMWRQTARFMRALPASARVLDAGCGPGRDLARFRAAGLDAYGVDRNIAFATRAGVPVADLRALPYASGTFAGVWACASLVHLDPGGVALALRELVRVCAPGGRLYASIKGGGTQGWRSTVHGRRWFQVWRIDEFCEAAWAAGWQVDEAGWDGKFGEFVDLWGSVPGGIS